MSINIDAAVDLTVDAAGNAAKLLSFLLSFRLSFFPVPLAVSRLRVLNAAKLRLLATARALPTLPSDIIIIFRFSIFASPYVHFLTIH